MENPMETSMQESELESIECFQNYTAAEVFVQGLAGLVNFSDSEVMIRAQKQMLQRFEKTNEMLVNCNALSSSRLKLAQDEYKKMTKLLLEMKKDLDYIFKKVRIIKGKLNTQYPTAFTLAEAKFKATQVLDENEEDEEILGVQITEEGTEAKPEKPSEIQYVTLESNKTDSSE
ncbi:kxDL motif-containing protein CG10681 [Culicoides brevitarsis]|uniref:kxDL motif-containing protein CG10681 n=1 Tax=Culicoides brevitarsis TaxID=469753 RepID=UPI00307BFC74